MAHTVAYTRVCEISQGGMGYVELVLRREGRFRRFFARKRLYPPYRNDPAFRAMFLDEARLAALVHHPNVVSVVDAGEDEEGPFLITDLVEGLPVGQLTARSAERGTRLPLQIATRIGAEAARGLHAAHEVRGEGGELLGLVHRDVSPQNILIGFDGAVRVTDFGIAKALGNASHTQAGVLKGNLGYLSPEQLRFEEPDRRSDLFSLGVVLYELVAGLRLYPNEQGAEGARRILREPPPDLADARPDVPPALVELLFELLAKRREKRPATAHAVALRLEAILGRLVAEEGVLDAREFMHAHFEDVLSEQRALRARSLERLGAPDEAIAAPEAAGRPARSVPPIAETETPRSRRQAWRAGLGAGLLLLAAAGVLGWARGRPTPEPAGAPSPPGEPSPAPAAAPPPPAAGARTVWAGSWHTCAVENGILHCWGKNNEGQLGIGLTLDMASRQRVKGLPPVGAVGLGSFHSCACTREGQLHCWGRNAEGQLGTGSRAPALEPVAVTGISDCLQVAAGARHTCVLRRSGAVVCFGSNARGQAGQGSVEGVPSPRPVEGLEAVAEIDADGDFTCARRAGGAVLCWGDNAHGQLGDGTLEPRSRPVPVRDLDDASSLGLGRQFGCAVRKGGAVVCWGREPVSGTGWSAGAPILRPIEGRGTALVVTAGEDHACAADVHGGMWCWGRNNFGQIGDGTRENRAAPAPVTQIPSVWLSIAAGAVHTCGRHMLGLACWGRNGSAQLGDGTSEDSARPISVVGFRGAY